MVPVASVHRAQVSGDFELAFKCVHCGEHARARVRATGRGEATGIPFARRPADLAEQRARSNLPADAREVVELARCPKCRRRGARGIKGWWLVHVVQVVFVLAIFVGVPALLFRFPFEFGWLLVFLLLLLVVSYLAIRFFVRLRQVDRSVAFEP